MKRVDTVGLHIFNRDYKDKRVKLLYHPMRSYSKCWYGCELIARRLHRSGLYVCEVVGTLMKGEFIAIAKRDLEILTIDKV